jgi:hypothetical protein
MMKFRDWRKNAPNGSLSKNFRFLKIINIREAKKSFYCLHYLNEEGMYKKSSIISFDLFYSFPTSNLKVIQKCIKV